MIRKETYKIETWKYWDDTIDNSVEKFYDSYNIYPNIIIAHEDTFIKIEMVVNSIGKKYIKGMNGKVPDKGEFVRISSFSGESYELDFCLDNNVQYQFFTLIYDSDPDGGGEPLPYDSDDSSKYNYRSRVA